ncbi:ROK family protein [Rhizosphaericola mali]|uniref:ROK family protein n=1 Tax=Rhizosphaericola mali TaxID=2545455 RepID=A0A5P2G927_9BACT|nr:ROK family protein [Rhizosphaericola mali]QES89723.1 ROK family protein [Rhizosphaericola mali]
MSIQWRSFKGLDTPLKKGIVRQLYYENNLSSLELSEALGKSVPLITKVVNDLISSKWVEEAGRAPSSGGRRPMKYSLRKNDFYVISVVMNRFSTSIIMLDLQNNPISAPMEMELLLKDNEEAVNVLIHSIKEVVDKANIEIIKILGVGISMPGFIDINKGINFSYLQLPNKASLRDYISEAIDLPVFIDNDSSTLALAELRFGEGKGKKDVMVINVNWGIGLGMIVKGELYRGHSGFAGELSHIPIAEDGLLCDCGKKGCLETEGTLLVVAKKAIQFSEKKKEELEIISDDIYEVSEHLMDAAKNGNQDAITLFSEIGSKIGRALAILIHIENPEQIILSGRGAKVGRILLAPIQQSLNQYCIPKLMENTELTISKLGKNSALMGSVALVMENFN